MRPPVTASNRSLVSSINAAAPETHSLIEVMSTLPAFTLGWFSSAMNRVGTPGRKVGRVFSIFSTTSSMSRGLGISTIGLRPRSATACRPTAAKTWNSGRLPRKRSSHSTRYAAEPRANLHSGHDHGLVRGVGGLRDAGSAAGEQDKPGVIGPDRHLRPRRAGVLADQIGEPQVAALQLHAVPFLLFLGQHEQQPSASWADTPGCWWR